MEYSITVKHYPSPYMLLFYVTRKRSMEVHRSMYEVLCTTGLHIVTQYSLYLYILLLLFYLDCFR